ncbi:galanin receptor 2a-like [Amphiura filiformis]|uniref:galanin receptor 2a-like n=1 Tax=Amphiura filiformis TaxID=82378 RepID=UPI003B228618
MASLILNKTMDKNTTVPDIYLVPVPWDWRLIIQLILAIVGIAGNSIVMHVYLHTRTLTMSATNRFIAALAVADIITSICIIPIPTLSYVPDNFGGHFYCKVVYSSFMLWISIFASILSLTVLAVERFVAIAQPIRYKRLFSVKMTRFIIIMIWVFSFTFETFILYTTHLDKVTGECYVDFGSVGFQMFTGVSAFFLKYLVPLMLMLVANIRAIQLLKMRALVFNRKTNQKSADLDLLQARKRIIKMLLAVIICFAICWSPNQFGYLAFNLGLVPSEYLYSNLYRVLVVLAFANSCLNPVLYALTNKNFRRAIKKHLFRCSVRTDDLLNNGLFDTPLETSELSGSNKSTGGTDLSINIILTSISASKKHYDDLNPNNI